VFELKGYNQREHAVREFSSTGWSVSSIYKLLQYLRVTGRSTVVPAVPDDVASVLILLMNW